jgi:hypothetical protein
MWLAEKKTFTPRRVKRHHETFHHQKGTERALRHGAADRGRAEEQRRHGEARHRAQRLIIVIKRLNCLMAAAWIYARSVELRHVS